MSSDPEFLVNYRPDTFYVTSAKEGSYATMVGDSEEFLGEINVSSKCKLAVSAFFVNEKGDYSSFKVTRLQFTKAYGWSEHSSLRFNGFQLAQLRQFTAILSGIDLKDAKKMRVSLDNIHVGAIGAIITSSKGPEIIRELSSTPELHIDIYAIAAKRAALAEFERNLAAQLSEADWQQYFETNPWIFGHGLNYVFLDKVGEKLETRTTGSAFDQSGKRVDALMMTKAEVSQYVLVEIKKNNTSILQSKSYRPGCWTVSHELSDAVTQIQKTCFEFSNSRFRSIIKDRDGNDTGQHVYAIEPKSYLVIGNLSEIVGNDDKIACFELYRRNIRTPEIVTFDELYQRARCIVGNISREIEGQE